MRQLCKDSEVEIKCIEKIILAKDIELNTLDFIFYKTSEHWFQIYLDEGVLFIQKIDLDIEFIDYFEDLDQNIIFELNFENNDYLIIRFFENTNSIAFNSRLNSIEVKVTGNNFSSVQMKYHHI